jgi:hypothetical protein
MLQESLDTVSLRRGTSVLRVEYARTVEAAVPQRSARWPMLTASRAVSERMVVFLGRDLIKRVAILSDDAPVGSAEELSFASGDLVAVYCDSNGDGTDDAIEVGQLIFFLALYQKSSGDERWMTAEIGEGADRIIESFGWTQ